MQTYINQLKLYDQKHPKNPNLVQASLQNLNPSLIHNESITSQPNHFQSLQPERHLHSVLSNNNNHLHSIQSNMTKLTSNQKTSKVKLIKNLPEIENI